eukprot:TRINITY_DN9339_c0_g2_i1.p1 TRINITY_DN9339_c0_g2~~TRINITY_DN9339_c0_g2_i1.p1  ORF type:complete len:391 (-),score=39.99 TRINITY_DN9339_c0_g2_i1:37-1209(-)
MCSSPPSMCIVLPLLAHLLVWSAAEPLLRKDSYEVGAGGHVETGSKFVRRRTLPHRRAHTRSTPKKAGQCEVAILISGQMQRFIWRDSLAQNNGKLLAPSKVCPEPVVDIYIALKTGTMAKPWVGDIACIPYINQSTAKAIKEFYHSKGARHVRIQTYSDKDMQEMQTQVEKELTRGASPSEAASKIDFARHDKHKRWNRYLSMFYLRHLAYSMVNEHRGKARNYKLYLYSREDNYWMKPFELDTALKLVNVGAPVSIVDEKCGWGGYPDKMFAANAGGAELLFAATFQGFVKKMVKWHKFAWSRAAKGNRRRKRSDPFQTEGFVKHNLANCTIEFLRFPRADARYVHGNLCVLKRKAKCSPGIDKVLPVCPDALRRKRKKQMVRRIREY